MSSSAPPPPGEPPPDRVTDLAGATDAGTQAEVRTLLATQPQPGPMPPGVVDRVEAALAQAASRRAADHELFDELGFADPASQDLDDAPGAGLFDGGPAGSPGDGGAVRPFARRRWPVLAAAAAAVVLIGGGAVVGLVQVRRSADAIAAMPGAGAPAFAGTTHVQVSSTAYTQASLPAAARTLVSSPGQEASSGDAPSAGPLATKAGLDSCITGLNLNDASAVFVDLATYEGKEAAIVVARKQDALSAYVVERDCSATDPGLVQDAVPVP